jgi:IclR family acetate operon transcriptional repressor
VASQHGTQSVDRAAELLRLVVEADTAMSFTGLTNEIGLAKSTTSRLLQALERNRLVTRDRLGTFVAGPLFTVYAARHDPVDELVQLARPSLECLGEQTGETVNLSVPRGNSVVQVAQIESSYLLGSTNWVGVDVPAHCSALGKVFYAYGTIEPPTGPLERRTPRTITSTEALQRDLEAVRRAGYGLSDEELEPGQVAIAAPIRFPDGRVSAAISLSGPATRLKPQLGKLATLLSSKARDLSALLGYPARKDGAA